MNRKQKRSLFKIIISIILFAAVMILTHTVLSLPWFGEFALFAAIYLICGLNPIRKAVINISHGQIFDENFLMCIATIGAFTIGEFHEAVEVIIFYQIGQLFESIAVGRSRKAVSDLMDICPDEAVVIRDGVRETVPADEIEVGEHIIVSAGERIAADGIVVNGTGNIDTSALTGESVPLDAKAGVQVLSGCINLDGTLEIEVTKISSESTAAKIMELVEESAERKARTEAFITKFARFYTPAVVIGAVLLALVPPMFTGFDFAKWVFRALTFLIVSCPCALVISVPLSFFSGIGCASKNGILIKGSSFVEVLAKAKTIVMDKTGTLTKGTFSVTKVHSVSMDEKELLSFAAHAESVSSHPIAKSIRTAHGAEPDYSIIENQTEKAGFGVSADIDGKRVLAGKSAYLKEEGIACIKEKETGTAVHIAVDGEYAGYIIVSDTVKDDASSAIEGLRKSGAEKIVMLTGDKKETAKAVSEELCLDEAYAELLPADKVEYMQKFREELAGKGSLIFVGDGMNDAPVLAQSDAGVAMGAMGSDAAIEAADIVIMDDKPSKLVLGIKIARKTMGIAKQNIVFALAVKAAVLVLSAAGFANMELAVFADVGVSVIAILNAMRAGKIK
ncbi:MAG: cadmium-translocating P-type ATPase [Ruminococcus sp.]|nr:cadmium-translocating P-type ATPase [Ruminococcus sp.]